MTKRSLSFAAIALLAFSCQSSNVPFSKKDVKHAQKLYGLEFDKENIKTMHNYLGRNLTGYDSIRKESIDINVAPALSFDPRPSSFNAPSAPSTYTWEPEAIDLPANKEELAFFSIRQLAYLLKNQKITSEELTEIYLNRIEKYDPKLQAVITVTKELALKQARKADQEIKSGNYKGLLHGIPYGTKDLMAVEGYPTTWGAEPYKNQQFDYTASVVKQLEEAGAVLIAKLVSGTLARGDVWFGGQTKNPWDLSQGASGSSAGSGSATSAGLVAFSLGTETLGSIVSPSTRCGVTGLRPSYGRVSRTGVMTLSWSMDKVGPICRSAEDCAIVLSHILGKTSDDPSVMEYPYGVNPTKDISKLKVAYLGSDFARDSSAVGNNARSAMEKLKAMGVEMKNVSLPNPTPSNIYDIVLRAESGAFFDELIRSGDVDKLVEQDERSRANSLRQSRFIPAVEYLQANRERKILIEAMHKLMKEYDVVIAPTFGSRQMQITNLTGHPALAVPTGFDLKGRPTSITFLSNLFEEDKILELAMAFQQKTEFDDYQPPTFAVK